MTQTQVLEAIRDQCKDMLQSLAEQAAVQQIFAVAHQLAEVAGSDWYNAQMRQAWRERVLASMHTDHVTPRSKEELRARVLEYRQ